MQNQRNPVKKQLFMASMRPGSEDPGKAMARKGYYIQSYPRRLVKPTASVLIPPGSMSSPFASPIPHSPSSRIRPSICLLASSFAGIGSFTGPGNTGSLVTVPKPGKAYRYTVLVILLAITDTPRLSLFCGTGAGRIGTAASIDQHSGRDQQQCGCHATSLVSCRKRLRRGSVTVQNRRVAPL